MSEEKKSGRLFDDLNEGKKMLEERLKQSTTDNVVVVASESVKEAIVNAIPDATAEEIVEATESVLTAETFMLEEQEAADVEVAEPEQKPEQAKFRGPLTRQFSAKENKFKFVKMAEEIRLDFEALTVVKPVDDDIKKNLDNARNAVFKNKVTKEVILPNSGYIVYFLALSLNDVYYMKTLQTGDYSEKKIALQMLYNKVAYTNITQFGTKPDFDTWLKITSWLDLDTLYYALYAATYPDKTEFKVTCNLTHKVPESDGNFQIKKCGKENRIKVYPEQLVQEITSQELMVEMERISFSPSFGSDLINESRQAYIQRVVLPNKIIVEVNTPSLYDYLYINKIVDPDTFKTYEDVVNTLIYVKRILVPDMDYYSATGKLRFIEVDKRETIFDMLIHDFATDEYMQIVDGINSFVDKYTIRYMLPRIQCAGCGKDIEETEVDLSYLIFR